MSVFCLGTLGKLCQTKQGADFGIKRPALRFEKDKTMEIDKS
ncbi:hypothetical protein VPMS16_351 [Vibrio sp. 16]|nr:hypothetical protein VPMS16_351 [Vibrio sp. 16]